MDLYSVHIRVSALLETIVGRLIEDKPVEVLEHYDRAIIDKLVPQLVKLRDLKFKLSTDMIVAMFTMPNHRLVHKILAEMSTSSVPDSICSKVIHYMDIEGTVEMPTEIAIITGYEGVIINHFHVLIRNYQRNTTEHIGAKVCHGIPPIPSANAATQREAIKALNIYLEQNSAITLVVHGSDCQQLVDFGNFEIEQAELPKWDTRPFHFSHVAAQLVKNGQLQIDGNIMCDRHNHRMYAGERKTAKTLNQINKAKHGYHCALADALELMLWHGASDETK